MGEPLVAEPTTEQSPLSSTNSVAYQSAEPLPASDSFGIGDIYRVFIIFCDKYSLNKKQVALGVFLSFLLLVFSIGTVIAWNRYNPIIQEFIIKENIEKARKKSNEKNSKERRMKKLDKFKKFFNKARTEVHFRNSGEGVRLSSGEGSSDAPVDRQAAADRAAQAAERRMKPDPTQQDASKRRIQMIAKRELEEERRKMETLNVSDTPKPKDEEPKELDHSSAISSILFTSELLGDDHARPREVLQEGIKKYLNDQIRDAVDEDDKAIAAILMIHNLNKTQVREAAVDIIGKICSNILENPDVPKFKSIRLGNNAYQNKIAPAIGGRAFLEAIGFVEQENNGDPALVFTRKTDEHLVEALGALKEGQPKAPKLTPDFFNLTTAELKAEQEPQVERMLTLRTKEMREKDELNATKKYKYTLIRVRLPGNILIQGVFGCSKPFSNVPLFVASSLSSALVASEFSLRDAAGQFVEDENTSLVQLGHVSAALLHMVFTEPIEGVGDVVADEYLDQIRELE
ncbi:unnamed protein product [Caenorhabditis brenneri]